MKVLWLINITLPFISKFYNEGITNSGGWLVNLSKQIPIENELVICYPSKIERFDNIDNVRCYGITVGVEESDLMKMVEKFKKIINNEKPNVIHVWGTEHLHSYAMVCAAKKCERLEQLVVSIQGLVSVFEKHYMASLPWYAQIKVSIRDVIRRDTLITQQKNMKKRGQFEQLILKEVRHVIGRTSWDKVCSKLANDKVEYHFNNEILRDSFYENCWDIEKCDRYSIFVSQAQYPIKGFHNVIEAISLLKDKYPELKVFVAGVRSPIVNNSKPMGYTVYLTNLAKQYDVLDRIEYVGSLSEKEMCEQFLKSNVFVSASAIENSPNSVGEAMLLGVPTVASYVGGTKDMLSEGIDGYLYQYDAPYMLAGYIDNVFSDECLAKKFSINARNHAMKTHSRENNYKQLIQIYKKISE